MFTGQAAEDSQPRSAAATRMLQPNAPDKAANSIALWYLLDAGLEEERVEGERPSNGQQTGSLAGKRMIRLEGKVLDEGVCGALAESQR